MSNKIDNLVVDTTAFINAAPLQEIANNVFTVQEVVDEITNKRQLRRLVVLPYDLVIKDVFPESIQVITDFAKKTGDYPSLSATDIKVMALTYQLEKEKVGTQHLRTEPIVSRTVISTKIKKEESVPENFSGFYLPAKEENEDGSDESEDLEEEEEFEDCVGQDHEEKADETKEESKVQNENKENENVEDEEESIEEDPVLTNRNEEDLSKKFEKLDCGKLEDTIEGHNVDDILKTVDNTSENEEESSSSGFDDDDDEGWITPSNVQKAKKQMDDKLVEDKPATVACITTDFAMQNVLKQMNLNVAALDGRLIRQIRTFILRCYTCFKTTSLMEKVFCPKCGHKTLKKVGVSLDENGKEVIHINGRKPLTPRGKKFSLPTFKGGKHSNNPQLSADQPCPQQRVSRQARIKNNPLDPDYVAGYSPFVMRDTQSRSALLGIRQGVEVKHWMRKNPNEVRKKRK